ncbi:MAG: arylesterase [Bryobacteraceae bacterium]|nr:arylesterase [Bryobacteraceae bacterium]
MRVAGCLLAVFALLGCGPDRGVEPAPAAGEAPSLAPPAAAADPRPAIVAFGDSLSAGFGVPVGQSYPDFLQQRLDEAGLRYRVVNAGVSGDTTSGGLSRIESIIAMKPALVVLELGGNDGLRGLPIESTRANLERIVTALKPSGAVVVLAGMTLPPNYGAEYIGRFERVYKDLAAKHGLALVPFFEGMAGRGDLMQPDGIHFSVEGNRVVAGQVFRTIEPLLKR